MILGKKTLKSVENKFFNYQKIKDAIIDARAEQDSKGILYLLESADGTREWVQEYWIEEEEKDRKQREVMMNTLLQSYEDSINPFRALFKRLKKES